MRHPHDFTEDCRAMMALSDRLNHPEAAAYFDGNPRGSAGGCAALAGPSLWIG